MNRGAIQLTSPKHAATNSATGRFFQINFNDVVFFLRDSTSIVLGEEEWVWRTGTLCILGIYYRTYVLVKHKYEFHIIQG